MAYNHPAHLQRLVGALDSPESVFYIHIDAKHLDEMNADAHVAELRNKPNVTFVPSIKVYWGGVTQVKATLILLREALKDERVCRFTLLSGVDYPVKPIAEINDFFRANQNDYIQYVPEESSYTHYIDRYYFYDGKYFDPRTDARQSLSDRLVRFLLLSVQRLTWLLVQKLHIRIRSKLPFKYYHGSNWFSLSRHAAEYVTDYLDRNPWVLKRFSHTAVCDESFFIMLLMRPEYDGTVVNDDLRLKRPDGKLFRGGRCLDITDYDRIKRSPAFWARKMSPDTSAELLDRLDADILSGHEKDEKENIHK